MAVLAAPRRDSGSLAAGFKRAFRTPTGTTGILILSALGLMALLAPIVAPYDPVLQHPGFELARPFGQFILGTDEIGRDLFSRIIYGARVSFVVAILAVGVGTLIGVPTGLIAGYRGGAVDATLMRFYDVVLTFPGIIVAVAVVSVLGPGSVNVAWALAVGVAPGIARLARSSTLRERQNEYVVAARSCGLPDHRIIWNHIFPNTIAPLIVQVSLALGTAVLAEAGLSFLGLGTQPPDPSWGGMLSKSRTFLREAPWYGIFPGVALALFIFGLNSVSDALRDALDPRGANLK